MTLNRLLRCRPRSEDVRHRYSTLNTSTENISLLSTVSSASVTRAGSVAASDGALDGVLVDGEATNADGKKELLDYECPLPEYEPDFEDSRVVKGAWMVNETWSSWL